MINDTLAGGTWTELIVRTFWKFLYACGGIYFYVVQTYGARDAMVIFFGAFAFITLVLIRGDVIRKTTGGMKAFRTPGGIMVVKVFEGGVRFFASAALVLGFMALAHYRNLF